MGTRSVCLHGSGVCVNGTERDSKQCPAPLSIIYLIIKLSNYQTQRNLRIVVSYKRIVISYKGTMMFKDGENKHGLQTTYLKNVGNFFKLLKP